MNANLIAINPLPSVSGTQRPNQSFTGIRNLPAGELAGEMGKKGCWKQTHAVPKLDLT
jgi:hypothetical protein